LESMGFDTKPMNWRVFDAGERFEYGMMIQTRHPANFSKLANKLTANAKVREFRIAPTGD